MEPIKIEIVTFNIHGLATKILFPDFMNYLSSCDIFILVETWIEKDKYNNFEKYFKNFKLTWLEATRVHRYGRAMGGMLIGIKKGLKYTAYTKNVDIVIKTAKNYIRLVPIYLNCESWSVDFERLVTHLNDVYCDNLILIGDFNARTKNLQDLEMVVENVDGSIRRTRQSEDEQVNDNGKKILQLCNDLSLVILNGRTIGDTEGKFTFIGGVGKSVIDYCLISQQAKELVSKFSIESQMHSDHLPLKLELVIKEDSECKNDYKLLPKTCWNNSKQSIYNRDINKKIEV